MSDAKTAEPNGTIVTVDFIRHRNVLLARADLSPLFVDYYLHLADHGIKHAPGHDRLLKDALAAFALHCASRPKNEHIAWTMNFQDPRLNLFLTGDNEDCFITGRLFTENVREADENVFYSEVMAGRGGEKRRSVVTFAGADVFAAVESYYNASEQRPARYFHLGEDNYAMLSSHPDCDLAWLASVDVAGVKALPEKETLTQIERRLYQWHCGCNQKKILGALAPAARNDMSELFGDAESIRVECPRCAASHLITREAMEAHLQA
jgi:molecular chaperone Hsp33